MLGSGRIRARIPRLAEPDGDTWGTVAGSGEPLRLAVLGDSAAAGVGAPDQRSALAAQTAEALAELTGRQVSWRVSARSGATARTARQDLIRGIIDPGTRWVPDLVVVVVGVNDAVRLRRPGRFRRDIEDLVAAIRHQLGVPAPVLLAGLPPLHRFPALPAPLRKLLGAHARRLDRQLTGLARQGTNVFHLPIGHLPVEGDHFFASDGFHPGPIGYREWGRVLATQTAPILETALPVSQGSEEASPA